MDSSSNDHQELEQVESIDDLLEDFWFFDNLLDKRSRTLRYCHSDPYPFSPPSSSSSSSTCTSLNLNPEKTLLEASIQGDSVRPPCIETKEVGSELEKTNKTRRQFSEKVRVQERISYLQKKESVLRKKGFGEGSTEKRTCSISKSSVQSSSMGGRLQRTQTLPIYIGSENDWNEFQYQESDDSRMGFLIREAIASSSSGFTPSPTKQNTPKVSSIPRHRPPRNSISSEDQATHKLVVKSQRSPKCKTPSKMLSSIETTEILMLKDLDIKSEKQEEEEARADAVKSRSAAVVGQPVVSNDSSRDMKAQIKLWARTVASNVG